MYSSASPQEDVHTSQVMPADSAVTVPLRRVGQHKQGPPQALLTWRAAFSIPEALDPENPWRYALEGWGWGVWLTSSSHCAGGHKEFGQKPTAGGECSSPELLLPQPLGQAEQGRLTWACYRNPGREAQVPTCFHPVPGTDQSHVQTLAGHGTHDAKRLSL